LIEGDLYEVSFQTPLGAGYGVVHLIGGELIGGDSMMYDRGTYTEERDRFSAEVGIATHSSVPGMGSVFGVPSGRINLNGGIGPRTITAQGSSPQAPGLTFQCILTKLD
jgi:hypothetical protein